MATGEACQNRVIFKQLLQADAIRFCQVDSCRMGGVNEVLAVMLMAAKFGVPVCPHAGGVGLCEYVQHLSLIDYIAISGSLEDRILEYVDHLHEHFVDPVRIRNARYLVPDRARIQHHDEARVAGRVRVSRPAGNGPASGDPRPGSCGGASPPRRPAAGARVGRHGDDRHLRGGPARRQPALRPLRGRALQLPVHRCGWPSPTARRRRVWRTLNLENEHLRVSVLPDLGGRLWRAVDKANGAQMFYANPSLKFAQVAYRGAWATFGIEFNFPVSHNWMTSSPVDYALVRDADGSASIVVGNIDLVYGMQWRVALTLRPGRSVLEQATTLYNRSDTRHRFYWWTNAAVEAWDDSQLVYPMEFTATHGFTQVDTWPVDSTGVDLSRPGNHLKGAVSLFSHGSREPFMGVYHPRTRAGVAHWADPRGAARRRRSGAGAADAEGLDWRRALSDNDSAEVEIQAGLFRNQETYAFLEPQEIAPLPRVLDAGARRSAASRGPRRTPSLNVARGERRARSSVGASGDARACAGGRLRVRDGDARGGRRSRSTSRPAQTLERTLPGARSARRATRWRSRDARGARADRAHRRALRRGAARPRSTVGPQRAPRVPARRAADRRRLRRAGPRPGAGGQAAAGVGHVRGGARAVPGELRARAGRGPPGRRPQALRRGRAAARAGARPRQQRRRGAVRPRAAPAPRWATTPGRGALWEAAAHFRPLRAASLLQLARLAGARAGIGARALRVIGRGAWPRTPG